jgi:hypothetical protein
MKLPGVPDDLYEHYQVGMNGGQRDEWQFGPFRLVRVVHEKGKPWLADLGHGVSALGATPAEACAAAQREFNNFVAEMQDLAHSGGDTLRLLK